MWTSSRQVCGQRHSTQATLFPTTGLQVGVDETPLMYGAKLATYDQVNKRSVLILGCKEKRMVTGTPCTTPDGNLLLFQIIWRGISDRVHPKVPGLDPRIVHFHAPRKCQTAVTFGSLLQLIDQRLASTRRRLGMPVPKLTGGCSSSIPGLQSSHPGIVVCDNAPSHLLSLTAVQGGQKYSPHLYRFSDSLYVYLTLKNRSHMLNSGDQFINRSIRPRLSFQKFIDRPPPKKLQSQPLWMKRNSFDETGRQKKHDTNRGGDTRLVEKKILPIPFYCGRGAHGDLGRATRL